MSTQHSARDLLLVPTLVTLAITILRLFGELYNWSAFWFNPTAGGGGAPIGIVWLVPIFGFWFGWKLSRDGSGPESLAKAFLYPVGAIVVLVVGFTVANYLGFLTALGLIISVAASWGAVYVAGMSWKRMGSLLLVYGLAARIPVAVIMLIAILGDWQTHYDVVPPGYSGPSEPFMKWVVIGLVPQLTFWLSFTNIVGGIFGAVAAALSRR